MIKKILMAVVLILPNTAFSTNYYGAFAYNKSTGQLGYSYDYKNKYDAINRALNECGNGCKIIARFKNICAAFAKGRKAYGWATSTSLRVAKESALQQCYKYGGQRCRVKKTICTRGNYQRKYYNNPVNRNNRNQRNRNQRNKNLKYY